MGGTGGAVVKRLGKIVGGGLKVGVWGAKGFRLLRNADCLYSSSCREGGCPRKLSAQEGKTSAASRATLSFLSPIVQCLAHIQVTGIGAQGWLQFIALRSISQ